MAVRTLDDDLTRLSAWCDSILSADGSASVTPYIGNSPNIGDLIRCNPVPVVEGEIGMALAQRIAGELDRFCRSWAPTKSVSVKFRADPPDGAKLASQKWHSDRYCINIEPGPIDYTEHTGGDAWESVVRQFDERAASGVSMDGGAQSAQNGSFWAIMGLAGMNKALEYTGKALERAQETNRQLAETNSQLANDAMQANAQRIETQVKADAEKQLAARTELADGMKLEMVKLFSTNVDRLMDLGISHLAGKPPSDADSIKKFIEGYAKSNPSHMQQLLEANGITKAPETPAALADAIRGFAKRDPAEALKLVNSVLNEIDVEPS